jgi:hypothetical protein
MKRYFMKSTVLAGSLLALAGSADAQQASRGPGGFVGFSLVAGDPVGELGSAVDQGFGVQIAGGAPIAMNGILRIRGDLGVLVYGHERFQECSFGCRVFTDLTTTNSIVSGGIGPELVLGSGSLQPYAHASVGLSYFVTSSSLNDHDGYGPYMETTNYSDLVLGWAFGGGLRMRIGGGRKPVYLDLGVRHHDNGIANYLTEGDIVDQADGSVTIYPNRSEADLMSFHLGITVGLPS